LKDIKGWAARGVQHLSRSRSRLHRRQATSIGIHGAVGQRNAMTIPNALFCKTQSWVGRVKPLEEQAALPIINPIEMGQPSCKQPCLGSRQPMR